MFCPKENRGLHMAAIDFAFIFILEDFAEGPADVTSGEGSSEEGITDSADAFHWVIAIEVIFTEIRQGLQFLCHLHEFINFLHFLYRYYYCFLGKLRHRVWLY